VLLCPGKYGRLGAKGARHKERGTRNGAGTRHEEQGRYEVRTGMCGGIW
jgi:hypothetical protein